MAVTAFVSKKKTSSAYDPVLARLQLLALQRFRNAFGLQTFCRLFIMILGKETMESVGTRLKPFELNRIQLDLHDKGSDRNIVLKPRQIGSTTYHIICRLFIPSILDPGTSGLLISQTKPYGAQHFIMLQRALKNFGRTPEWVKAKNNVGLFTAAQATNIADELQQNLLHTRFSARHEILFDFLDSKVLVETAENKDAGTGLTLNRLCCTEVAYWRHNPEELLAQAKETVPKDGTIDLESTPNGPAGYFYEEWQRAKNWPQSEFKQRFYPWWWQVEYQSELKKPLEDISEEEQKGMEDFAWTMNQIAWRRTKQRSLRRRFEEKYPEDDQNCFIGSGDLFFDRDTLRDIKRRVMVEPPLESYQDGALKIYKRAIKGRRYIIGADVAEGKLASTENSDFSTAVVLDIDTGEEMASYRSRIPPEEFAQDLVDLAQKYNNALIAPERNGPGGSVILTVTKHLLYGNIYMHKEWFKEQKRVIAVAGFPTTPRTRPIALNKLAAMLRDAPEFWHDEPFIDEALNFVWTSSQAKEFGGKRVPQGRLGAHDDTVLARAVAAYVRLVHLGYLDPIEAPSEAYGYYGEPEENAA